MPSLFFGLADSEPQFWKPGNGREHFSGTPAGSNQIDSAFEYITEYVLGWNDFVPEQHKARQDVHFLKVNTCYFYCERLENSEETITYQNNPVHAEFIPGSLSEYDQEINPPPPKPI